MEYLKIARLLFLASLLFIFSSCKTQGAAVTILADGKTVFIDSAAGTPAGWLEQASLSMGSADTLLYRGYAISPNDPLPSANSYTLSIRRAVDVTIAAPSGSQALRTSAFTVGQALAEAGFDIHFADGIDPPIDTPLGLAGRTAPFLITYQPSQELAVTVDGNTFTVRSAASTVGAALAGAGIPLVGLDYSLPAADAPLPQDGGIRLVRVTETFSLAQQAIPYGSHTELSADLELDQQSLLKGGEVGLKITRTRTRIEDGLQVSQSSDGENVVRPPQDRILGIGTKVVLKTAVVDGQEITYWRSLTLYSTPYVPCVPNTNDCHYGTASGTRVRHGEVAMVYPWYLLLAGEHVYIPGYGFATVEDNNGAYTSAYWGTYWVDLGFAKYEDIDWVNHYVTVYFLAPVPANIADLYIMP
jgi:resuscitation-promoting factor RpfB